MAQRLAGKVAWVTGAGTGIGEAAALALVDEGAIVVLTGRRAEPLERLAVRIHQSGGVAHVQPGDLTDSAAPQRIGAFIKDTLGRLDILVNNAGLNIRDRHWDKLTPQGIDQLVHGNLSSTLYCVTVALPMMRAQQDGVTSTPPRWPGASSAASAARSTPRRSTAWWR
jgi:NADP-dependent 3-hydroxy acid dehydrogenase YdfG